MSTQTRGILMHFFHRYYYLFTFGGILIFLLYIVISTSVIPNEHMHNNG